MKENVLITGASGGIGLACAELFAENGFGVALQYNSSREPAAALARRINEGGGRALAIQAQLGESGAAESMVLELRTALGELSVLVNNAGISDVRLFTDTDESRWSEIISVNLGSVYRCSRAVLPHMLEKKRGSIVNVSSVWGVYGASCEAAYSASKAGIIGLTKSLAKELGPSGIRVNCVAPGVIDTRMNSRLSADELAALCDQTPLGRLGTPREAAQAVLFLASERASFVTGAVLEVTGGF